MKGKIIAGVLAIVVIGGGIIFGVIQNKSSNSNSSGTSILGKDSLSSKVKIGDYVSYNAGTENSYTSTKQKNGTNDQTFETTGEEVWRVLSIEDDGTINLVSENPIEDNQKEDFDIEGGAGYINFIDELNSICAIYGKGENAISARSMTYEDIIKVIGFNTFESAYNITLSGTDDEKIQSLMKEIATNKEIKGIAKNGNYGTEFTLTKKENQYKPSDENKDGHIEGGEQTLKDSYLPSIRIKDDLDPENDILELALGNTHPFWIANTAIRKSSTSWSADEENNCADYYSYYATPGGSSFDNSVLSSTHMYRSNNSLPTTDSVRTKYIRPVVTLNKDTKVDGGTGTKEDPFKI